MPSAFETALGKLSALLGDDAPEATAYGVKNALAGFPGVDKVTNALNPDPQVTNRASMLPIGNYDDGSVGPAWPQSIVDAKEAFGRFGRGEDPQPQDAVLAGLAMAGSGFGGLGSRAAGRAVSGRAMEGVETPRPLTSSPVEAGSAPAPLDFDARLGMLRDQLPSIKAGDDFIAQTPFEHVRHTDLPDGFAAWMDSRGRNPSRRPETVDLRDLRTFQRGIDGARAAEMAERGAFTDAGIPDTTRPAVWQLPSGEYVVQDGNHRLAAAALRGDAKADVDVLFSNPKEAAPAGLLAASSLDRMRVEDAARPRSIPEAPQSLPQLQANVDSNLDRYAVSRSVGDRAHAEDPARYSAYTNGLHDVMHPESQWFTDGPTLQSGGSMAPAAATGSSEHHSRSQPRGQGGRFVGKDSFDGRLASLDKMLVDLDGDGTPDVTLPVRPANALLARSDVAPSPAMSFPAVPPVGAPASPAVPPWEMINQENFDDVNRPYVPLPPPSDQQPNRWFDPRG